MNRTGFRSILASLMLSAFAISTGPAFAQEETPDAFIQRLMTGVLDTIRNDKSMRTGDANRLVALVDTRIMPNVNFQRMTAAAVGPAWQSATPEQQKRLQDEFKTLLIYAYAGVLAQGKDSTVVVKPPKSPSDGKDILIRTEIKSNGEAYAMDYRLEKAPEAAGGWRINNLKLMASWLVETYRSQFAQEISTKGIDGLIGTLAERNKTNAKKG